MPFTKSRLETRAEQACNVALAMLDAARDQLARAESSLVEEERQHAPHVGIANQHRIAFLAEIMAGLADVRHDFVQKVTGEPV